MRRVVKIGVVFFVVLSLASANLQATTITIDLTAEITYIDDLDGLLEGQINVGDIITGSYIYDSATPDTDALSLDTIGQYQHSDSPYGISLSAGGFVFETAPDNVDFLIGILNNHNGRDSYAFGSYNNLLLSNGVEVDYISWQLDDYSSTALSSDALPTTPPILEDWINNPSELSIRFGYKGFSRISADVTSVALVPEPGTVLLLGLGGLILLRKRRAE